MNAGPPLFSPIHLHAPETTPLASFESDTVPLLGSPSLASLVTPTDSIVIAVTDAKSLFRLCAWKVTRLAYRFALFSELGRSEEQVLTQNLIAVAYKAEPGR